MKLVIVNGYPGSGKSTFEQYCIDYLKDATSISTIDWVKDIARYIGWDGVKDANSRKFLSDLKQFLIEHNDLVFTHMVTQIESYIQWHPNTKVIFIDSREPLEIQRFVDTFGAETLFIERESVSDAEQSNTSDAEVEDFKYNIIIHNNSNLEQLKIMAEEYCHLYLEV